MKPFTILLTEDNPDHAMLVSELLTEDGDGVEVCHAENGNAALAYLDAVRDGEAAAPDLILLDLNMPGMDGIEVLRRIKADRMFRSVPSVVLSSSRARTDVSIAMREHANSYTVKSSDIDMLERDVKAIRNYWSQVQVATGQPARAG